MRWRLLLLLSVAAACSRGPSASQAYSEAWTAFREGNLPRAQREVDGALKAHAKDEPDALQPLRLLQIEILIVRGQAGKALDLLGKYSDSRDPELQLRWMADRADAQWKLGRAEQAKASLEELDRAAGNGSTGEWALKGLLLRGSMLVSAGRFAQADELLKNTRTRAASVGDSFNRAAALLNLSYSQLQQNRYDETIEYGAQALDWAQKIRAGRTVALANDNLGKAYAALGDLDKAAGYLNAAVTQLRAVDDLRGLEDALGGLGNIRLLDHKPAQAAQAFEEAVEVAKRADAKTDALRWAHRLGFAMIEQGNWDAAESWNRQAYGLLPKEDKGLYLKLNAAAIANGRGNTQDAERLYREAISDSKDYPFVEWEAYVRLGSLLAQERKFPEANAEYEKGIQAIERLQARVKDENRFTYQDLQMKFFKDYVELLVSEGQEGQKERALQVVEYSRARVLAEKLGRQPGTIDEVNLANFRTYAGRTGSVLVSYWLAPKRSFAWVIRSGGIQMRELPPAAEIEAAVRKYRKTIEEELRDPVGEGLPQAEQLRAMLLGPIQGDLAGARKVVVAPDGELHALNFETLEGQNSAHYWIEDVEVAVTPSLGVLGTESPKRSSKPSLLLVGAPVSPSAEYPDLPSARAEIDGIQKQFAGAGVVRAGAEATPRGFFDAMPANFSLIHFAAHAETNSQSPLESAVILSKNSGGDGGGNSYKLYARDVAQLHLSAGLVTISACRSAGAKAYGGEGQVGFAWAFLKAGAQAVIAGLWDVGDASSSRLMEGLYRPLASGGDPAAALRAAKLELLHSGNPLRKPFYWAPYQIYIR